MDEIVMKVLSAYGLAGVVIAALGLTVMRLWKDNSKVTDARLNDQIVLIKALENNTQATKENAAAIVSRNLVTESLSKAIEHQATMLELFMQKTDMQNGDTKDRLLEYKLVIDSFAESNRVNTGILKDVRDMLGNGRRSS